MIRRATQALVAAMLIASSCSAGRDDAASGNALEDTEIDDTAIDGELVDQDLDQQIVDWDDAELELFLAELSDDEIDEMSEVVDAPAVAGPAVLDEDAQATLAELQANGFCDPADIEDGGVVTAMHFVVDGQVQPPCSGEVDPRLDAAWTAMADVTPAALLADISLLAGFEGCDTCDTLAFVTTLDEAAEFFVMAIDVQAGVDDLNELALTMQHELTHVFTQDPETQLDISIDVEDCATYYSGTGCFREGSYTWEWIQQFWDAEALATIPDDGGVNEEAGKARCVIDAPYTGSYGASNPEEDIAEVFSAYVFDVEVSTALDAKLAFFDQYPEFREVRERAAALGRHEADYSFENC